MVLTVPRNLMLLAFTGAVLLAGCRKNHEIAVTTYHFDNMRTGWNSEEEKLRYNNATPAHFGMLHSVTLDEQVDAQPLVVPHVRIVGGPSPGEHEVVYVATENNTVYAIDAKNGQVLLNPQFGPPVPTPLGCTNNGPNVGINGTPVIDRQRETMYVVVYTLAAGVPEYWIHALDIKSLTDKMPAQKVAASHTLNNGTTTFSFQATYQRQRPGLLLANGNVYAGFGSFCDWGGSNSRGWILGWKADTLAALPANRLDDTMTTSPCPLFLSSVWMSGYGLAADEPGNLYFTTGNSDKDWAPPCPTTYDGASNTQESVLKLNGALTQVDIFTPSNVRPLDQADEDLGSGGAMVLPHQEGAKPHLLAAAGKDGRMFILDRDNLGQFTPGGPDKVVGQAAIGNCWCGPSYFHHRIVSSGAHSVEVWKVELPFPSSPEGTSAALGGQQDGGFFTSVSSHGDDDPIIWAVSRPDNPAPATVTLFALRGKPSSWNTLDTLFQGAAGTWPNVGGNANIVPVVANGRVYVASNKELRIFGLL
jgi:hypothetical protein